MENVKELLKTSLDEVDRLLSSRTVVGEPIQIGEATVIPLMSLGFGFGAGGGKGKEHSKKEGEGGGTGAGAGIKPVALIISDKSGEVRVQPITSGLGDALGKVASGLSKKIAHEDKQSNETSS